jgi:hypothetical protein
MDEERWTTRHGLSRPQMHTVDRMAERGLATVPVATPGGLERVCVLNYLSHYLLACLLLSALVAAYRAGHADASAHRFPYGAALSPVQSAGSGRCNRGVS